VHISDTMYSHAYVTVICWWLVIATADIERVQDAGHVHTVHEVDGKHNVEFDHEAILGVFICALCNSIMYDNDSNFSRISICNF